MLFKSKAYYFLIGFILVYAQFAIAQDQKVADSLKSIYSEDVLEGVEKLELLRNLSFNEVNNLDLALRYADALIAQAKQDSNYLYLYRGYSQKGQTYRLTGDLSLALNAFFKSSEAAIKVKNTKYEGGASLTIADVYSEMGNSNNAELYYNKAIEILRKTDDNISLATALLNAGDEALNTKKYDLALKHFEESGLIFKNADYLIGTAYNIGNVGLVYAEQGKNELAKEKIAEAISILEELGDYYAISDYLTYMSDIYLKQNDRTTALGYAQRSLNLAQKYGLKKQIAESNLKLSELHQQAGNLPQSFIYYKDYITYRDSVINLENIEKAADLRTNYEVSQKQTEVDLLNQQKKNQRNIVIATVIALFLIALLALGLYRRNQFIYETNKIIEMEKDRSDSLLLNILPEETANELKLNGKVKAKKFESVTVLFTDFKGFTHYAENLSPKKLVKSVDFYFSKFDEIMEKYGLEKIKTVGDAYMCAGGLPYPTEDHALKMGLAAFEITEFVEEAKKLNTAGHVRFDIRVGINTGPVVAGVVGTKKFAYDIWGDTVNIASRMESSSEPGKINVSENTYELIKDKFDCEYRGEIEVKNRGSMKMYFVKGLKNRELSKRFEENKTEVSVVIF
jgi:adenylate cyclase